MEGERDFMSRKISYLYKSIVLNMHKASKKYGKNCLWILIDMFYCMIRYSASPANYYYFGFAKLNHAQRKTYVTHKISEKIQAKYNQPKYHIVFYDKMIFSRWC